MSLGATHFVLLILLAYLCGMITVILLFASDLRKIARELEALHERIRLRRGE